MAPANEPGSDGQTKGQTKKGRGRDVAWARAPLLAIKLGLKWARALKEAAAAPAAAAANSAAGVIVAALLRQLPVQTAQLCSATLSLAALALSPLRRSLSRTSPQRRRIGQPSAAIVVSL